ncbi:MAG TPA: hypothetical protein EYN91_27160 [Candidatus Melainabacteria bacterium]|jgi:CII-binding regulator of phage lambda lysogenization HflD|nr:hypothetical protein [Candidatus Melainabacteria bacterium]
MTFPNQPSFKSTIEELRDAVNRSQGADHESAKLISQIESILEEIESKMRPGAQVTGVQMQQALAQENFVSPAVLTPAPIVAG